MRCGRAVEWCQILSKLFGRHDPLEDHAKRLVVTANIAAISAFVPLIDKYNFLGKYDAQDWDFYATGVASY